MEERIGTGDSAIARRLKISAWVAREIIPHEPFVKKWLARARATPEESEEVIQEAYCRISALESVDHIECAHAYFLAICRNILVRRLKRMKVVPMTTIAEVESFVLDNRPSPEREVAGRMDYSRMIALLSRLPERCGEIVRLRKIEGLSQRDIAVRLGTTEKAVEKQVWLGVKALRAAWNEGHDEADSKLWGSDTKEGRHR